eukprot:11323396-Alexandrium_andersonii.AAC.1
MSLRSAWFLQKGCGCSGAFGAAFFSRCVCDEFALRVVRARASGCSGAFGESFFAMNLRCVCVLH